MGKDAKSTGKKKRKSRAKKVPDLVAIVAKAREAVEPPPADREPEKATTEEVERLSRSQQAMVRAIGHQIWNQLTPNEKKMIRYLMVERYNITKAALRAGLHRSFHYIDSRTSAYHTACAHAEAMSIDMVESAIMTRGYRGVKRLVRYQGLPVPITDPRVPPLINPETNEPYVIEFRGDTILFRGYETEYDYSDTIGLATLKALRPGKWGGSDDKQGEDDHVDPDQVRDRLMATIGVNKPDDTDPLDQSYRIKDGK